MIRININGGPMNKFKNRKKRKLRIRLTKEIQKQLSKNLEKTMEEQRKTIMNLHVPHPGRRI